MKTVLITGGTKGIGKAIALKFLQNGYEVIINYAHDEESAYATQTEFNLQGYCPVLLRADVSKSDEVAEMFKEIYRNYGKLDVLINNAGISLVKVIQDTTLDDWQNVFATNVQGTFLCSKQAVNGMIGQMQGAIINVASIWGEVGASCEVAYSASKGAIIAFTKALAKELAPSQIRVNCVSPGVIDTTMNAHLTEDEMDDLTQDIPLGRLGTGEEVAHACLFLAENNYVTGEVISVGGGFAK